MPSQEMPVHWRQPGAYLFGDNAQVYRDKLWKFLGIEDVVDLSKLDDLQAFVSDSIVAAVKGIEVEQEEPEYIQ